MSCETLVEGGNGKDGFLAIVSFNGRRQQTVAAQKRKERVYSTCEEIETLSRTQQQTMAVATSPRRETNARLRPAGHLDTDGFTVKSLLKNAKVFVVEIDVSYFPKRTKSSLSFPR